MAEIPTRTAQHCAQCTAHGEISLLKGHKKICPFKECTCVHCVLVNNKRQIMAKQVKLKRLQEKNHGLRRARRSQAGKKRSSLLKAKEEEEDVSPEKKYEYLGSGDVSPEIGDFQHYQEEAWKAVCGPETLDDHIKCSIANQWCPVSPIRFTHINPLQLQPTSSFMHPRSPPITMATNFLPSSIPDTEIPSLNHIQTQPVYYTPPGYAVSLAQASQLPPPFTADSLLPLEIVSTGNNGHPGSIDAAQTLLTLRTGEE